MKNLILVCIIVLAFSLRFYKVADIPPSLNWDETSIGYNAYSILKTGKDEWGEAFPLHFKSFGEYKLPVQIYASIPGIYFLGLNEIGVRITPVVYGTLTVLFVYLLTQLLFKNKKVSLLSAFLLAVSPWHIQLTRASFESSFSLFWIVLALIFLVRGLTNPKWLIASVFPFVVSIYTYNTARVFTPLFLLTIAIIFRKYFWKIKIWTLTSAVLFGLFLIPLVPFVMSGGAEARYKLVSITDDKGLIPRIEERRNNSKLPKLATKLIHNRYTYNTYYFINNYLAHFTPNFLFIEGAGHKQHHVQGVGELYWIQAPFLLWGVYLLVKKKHESLKILFPWLFLTFIPVSMTNDSIPNALRTLIAVPVYQIFTAFGVYEFFKNVKIKFVKKILLIISLLIFVVNFAIYFKKYFYEYPIKYSRDWQYGNKQVVEYIKNNQDKYDLIVFSRAYGEPHIFTLFDLKYDPSKFQNDPNLTRFETHDWVRVLKFDKYYFPDLGDTGTRYEDIVKEYPDKKILFIGKNSDFPKDVKILERINFLNGENAFEIVEK